MMARTNESWLRKYLVLGGALLLGLLSASLALADHGGRWGGDWRLEVRDHADNVNYLSREIRQELVHVASHSCLFGQMMVEVGRMESNAAILRGWSRHQAPLRMEAKVHELAVNSDRLQALIEEAWQRGLRGWHRPLLCTQRLRVLLARTDAEIARAYHLIPGTQTVFTPPRPCGHWGVGVPARALGPIHPTRPTAPWGWSSSNAWPGDAWQGDTVRVDVQVGQGVRIASSPSTIVRTGAVFQDTSPTIARSAGKVSAGKVSAGPLPGLGNRQGHSQSTDRHQVGRRFPDSRGDRRN